MGNLECFRRESFNNNRTGCGKNRLDKSENGFHRSRNERSGHYPPGASRLQFGNLSDCRQRLVGCVCFKRKVKMTDDQGIKQSAFSNEEITEEEAARLSGVISVLLCVMLVFSVVFYGAVDAGVLAILTAIAGFIILFWLADAWKTGQFKYNSSRLQIPLLALILIGLIQLLPLRSFIASEELLSVESVSSLSLNPYSTRLAIIRLCVDFVF